MKKKRRDSVQMTDKEYEALVSESARTGLSRGAAAFHSMLTRCLNLPPSPPSDRQMGFLVEFDKLMRSTVPEGELRDDHDGPSLGTITGPTHGQTPEEDQEAFLKNYDAHMNELREKK